LISHRNNSRAAKLTVNVPTHAGLRFVGTDPRNLLSLTAGHFLLGEDFILHITPANNTSSGVSESEYDTTRQQSNRKRQPVEEDRNSNNGVHLAQLLDGAYERQLEAIKCPTGPRVS